MDPRCNHKCNKKCKGKNGCNHKCIYHNKSSKHTSSKHTSSKHSRSRCDVCDVCYVYTPTIINEQNKIIEPIDIFNSEEIEVLSIEIRIPESWNLYDLLVSGEVFVDGVDDDCGIVMRFKDNKNMIIGSQVIGYNNTGVHNGIGISGYHKELLKDQKKPGNLEFHLTIQSVNTLDPTKPNEINVINRQMNIQAIKLK